VQRVEGNPIDRNALSIAWLRRIHTKPDREVGVCGGWNRRGWHLHVVALRLVNRSDVHRGELRCTVVKGKSYSMGTSSVHEWKTGVYLESRVDTQSRGADARQEHLRLGATSRGA